MNQTEGDTGQELAVVRAMKGYAAQGLPVIPCQGKKPLVKGLAATPEDDTGGDREVG